MGNDAVASLIALITDETDRKTAQALFEKYEPLRGGVLRQSDYDRLMNEGKQKIQTAEERATKWENWAATNVPKHEELLKSYDTLEAEAKTLRQKVEDAARTATGGGGGGNGSGNLDAKAITDQVMRELGGKPASKQEIEALVSGAVQKQAAEIQEKFFKETLPQSNRWQGEMVDAQLTYHDEFGKRLDRKEFLKFMVENKIDSPLEALDKYVAKDRSEKVIKDEVDKRVAAELAKRHMPGVSGEGAAPIEMGPLQMRLAGKGPVITENTRPGDGSLAQQAADALRTEGKF